MQLNSDLQSPLFLFPGLLLLPPFSPFTYLFLLRILSVYLFALHHRSFYHFLATFSCLHFFPICTFLLSSVFAPKITSLYTLVPLIRIIYFSFINFFYCFPDLLFLSFLAPFLHFPVTLFPLASSYISSPFFFYPFPSFYLVILSFLLSSLLFLAPGDARYDSCICRSLCAISFVFVKVFAPAAK